MNKTKIALIIDSNIFLSQANIFQNIKFDEYNICTTENVYEELVKGIGRRHSPGFVNAINDLVTVIGRDQIGQYHDLIVSRGRRLSEADMSLLALAKMYASTNIYSIIVSNDREVIKVAKEFNIEVMDGVEFAHKFTSEYISGHINKLRDAAVKLNKEKNKYRNLSWVMFIVGVAMPLFAQNIGTIAPWLYRLCTGPFVFPFVVLFIGLIMFFVRNKFRLVYGLGEIAIGLAMAIKTSMEYNAYTETKTGVFVVAILLAIFGSIFIVIRGLDSVDKVVPDKNETNSLFVLIWCRLYR